MMEQKTVKVSVKVRSGTARFRVGVRARSVGEALSLVGDRYSRGTVRAVLPMQPGRLPGRKPPSPMVMPGTGRGRQHAA